LIGGQIPRLAICKNPPQIARLTSGPHSFESWQFGHLGRGPSSAKITEPPEKGKRSTLRKNQRLIETMKITNIPTRLALMTVALGLSASLPARAADDEATKAARETVTPILPNPLRSVTELIATIEPAGGSNVKGSLVFKKVKDGVEITVAVGGLDPDSEHAIHIHEFGNISAADGTSAGSHYNPGGHKHGLPPESDKMKHAGDFGNLKADKDGNAKTTFTVDNLTLTGRKNPIVGRSVIIHADKDDGGQPTGNAGARIGMGVIGVSKAKQVKHDH
jgi:Cu-Zn family superoxide dismutase